MEQRTSNRNEQLCGNVPNVGNSAGNSSGKYSPRITIVPSALDEPFSEGSENTSFGGGHEISELLDADLGEPTAVFRLPKSIDHDDALQNAEPDAEDDLGLPTQPRLQTLAPPSSSASPDAPLTAVLAQPTLHASHAADKWYLRLQLRKDCLADLWIRDLTPHNVLAWSDGMESWVPLLAVPELREAVSSAQDKKTRTLLANPQPEVSDGRVPLPPPRKEGGIVSLAPARGGKVWALPHPRPISSLPPPLPGTSQRESNSQIPKSPRITTLPPPLSTQTRVDTQAPPGTISQRPPAPTRSTSQRPTQPPPLPTRSVSQRPGQSAIVSESVAAVAAATADAPPIDPHRHTTIPPSQLVIPRPSRVPQFDASVSMDARQVSLHEFADEPWGKNDSYDRVPESHPPALSAHAEGTLAPPALSVLPKVPSQRQASLVNWERALWLVAGVSVASAASFVFGHRRIEERAEHASPAQAVSSSSVAATENPAQVRREAAIPKEETIRAEDLPLVGRHGRVTATIIAPTSPRLMSQMGSITNSASAPVLARGTTAPAKPGIVSHSGGSFDAGQARRVLTSAASRARSCSDGPASGTVQVVFGPNGMVQGAQLISVTGEGVRQNCVLRAFQEARLSPFAGDAVTVRKSFAF